MPLLAGTRIGPYEIRYLIGAGGMGEVYRAEDPRLGRSVAIKTAGKHFISAFAQEARAIAALNHPHICTLYDLGPDYLVMEYIEGSPIRGPLAIDEALRLGRQIAGALEEAHRKGVIHRDLKPGNILLTAAGSVKLLDFGLAKMANGSEADATVTLEGRIRGTLAYMSPEQAEGKPLDARSDIFSFGAVLYEMIAGSRAFPGDSMASVLSAVLRDRPAPLTAPAALAAVVNRCLNKDPAARFQSSTELIDALDGAARTPASAAAKNEAGPSIAVLPFDNMSGDKDNEYFSDGLAEEIINALVRLPGLKVTARTSSFALRGKKQDIRKIGEILGVRTVLDGSVRRSGSHLRVAAQLINATDGYHLWSDRYDREITDIFAMQDEIAQAIAATLQLKLDVRRAPRRHTPNIPAYEEYLKGLHYHNKVTPDSLVRAKACFENAAALDPEYALPHALLASGFLMLALFGLQPGRVAMPLARTSAQKALDRDPSQPEAHAILGAVAAAYDFDWREADRRFRTALDCEPVSPWVRGLHANFYLLFFGRLREAVEQWDRAVEADPLNLFFRFNRASCLQQSGQLDAAVEELRKILEIDENYWIAYLILAVNYAARGCPAESLAAAQKAYQAAPWSQRATGLFAGALHMSGDTGRADEVAERLKTMPGPQMPLAMTTYHLMRSDPEGAAEWFEKAIEQRDPGVIHNVRSPLGRELRRGEHWRRIMRTMNLPETAA